MSDFYSQPGGYGNAPQGGYGSPASEGGFPAAAFGAEAPAAPPAEPEAKKGRSSRSKQKSKAPKQAKKRPVKRQLQFAALTAIIVGGGAFYALSNSAEPQTWVARTADTVAAGVPLSAAQLEYVRVPTDLVETGAVSGATAEIAQKNAEEVLGLTPQYPLAAKAQIHKDVFGAQALLGEPLAATQRLVSLHAPISTAVAGSLVVGDRVDILTVHDGITTVVAYDVPIVAVTVSEDRYNSVADAQATDKDVKAGDVLPGDPVPGMYTVRVEADQTAALTAADAEGSVVFAYRGPGATTVEIPDFNPDATS